ncbi:hypothetical protein FALBO_3160 [Fusarium albosuccineum]|uniref:Uncharacterized protein n=1 Tax=Fusarium albosuccineum TaxID=1237068 RepID=A0A8H4LLQ2_9HYPO|nr:hypothetical protein FALBO_3160 [Fusarium albosuccineum]
MSSFFVDWDLWQEMTFVLGCCIILVFAAGFVKLWWTNRAMRRLEIIDEEKRARVSLMSHCGIDNLRPPEIPFGIRALQNGVEVEGIWISRSKEPESCQISPRATLVGHRVEMSKGKGRMIDLGAVTCPKPSLDHKDLSPVQLPTSESLQQDDTISTLEFSSQQTLMRAQTKPAQIVPGHQLDRTLQTGPRQDWRRSETSTLTSTHNPFSTPAQPQSFWSLSQVSAVSPEVDLSISELSPSGPERTSPYHEATRATQGRVTLPTGFRPNAPEQSPEILPTRSNPVQLQAPRSPAHSKVEPDRAKLRKVLGSKNQLLLSKSSSS